MVARKKGLGKGLDALLGVNTSDAGVSGTNELRALPVDLLQRSPFQPRMEFDQKALDELASSIRMQGVVQPIVVRPVSDSKYEIIAGERRWRAAQMAGLHEVPVVVRKVDDLEAMCLALIENIQREDLSPLEEARGLERLLDEFDMTHDAIAEAVGRSRSTISNLLRLLDLTSPVKQMLEQGELEMGHARALLSLENEKQLEAARQVVSNRLSVRETEALVRRLQQKSPDKPKQDARVDPDVRNLENDLSEKLGAPVKISHKAKGNGTLQIQYSSLDELDGILAKIK